MPPPEADHDLEVSTAPWSCLGYDGLCISTEHWDICTTILLPSLHERLPLALESALATMLDTVDPETMFLQDPPQRLTMCLLSDRRQWSNLTRVLLPEHAEAMQGLSRGGFTARGVAMLYDIDYRDHCRDTIALSLHEGWHQYAQTALPGELPSWLDEGIATVMEGYRLLPEGVEIDHDANRQRQRRAWWMHRRHRMKPFAEFIEDSPHDAMSRGRNALLDYYGQAWAMTKFMLDDPARAAELRAMVRDAADGRRPRSLEVSAERDEAFRDWCRAELAPSWWR